LTDLTTKAQRSQKVSKTSWSLCLCGELSRRSLVVVLGVLPPLIVRVNLPRTDVARRTTSDTREELLRQRLCVSEFAFQIATLERPVDRTEEPEWVNLGLEQRLWRGTTARCAIKRRETGFVDLGGTG